MELLDSHAHYNDEKFDEDRKLIIESIYNSGVTTIINAGYSLESSKKAIEIANNYNFMYATVGVSPNDIENLPFDYIEKLKNMARQKKVVAIGEIGLDYYCNKENKDKQQEIFIKQIELANEMNLPIVIHTREAIMDTIDTLKNQIICKNKGVFHCCPLNVELVREALKATNYSFDQFKANLAVQTINYSDTIDGEHRQEYIDSAIDDLQAIKDDKRYKEIISGLETSVKVDELQKGYIPVVTHKDYTQEQESKLRKEFRDLLNDDKIDLGDEFDTYRENYIFEASDKGRNDLAFGTVRGLLTGKKRLKQSQKDLEIQRAAYEEGRRKYAEQKELEYVQGVLEERQAEYERLTANLHDRITTRDKYK